MSRRSNNQRATDRLNIALAKISAAAELVDAFETNDNKQTAAATLRKQLGDALDEAHAALADVRHATSMI